MSKVKRISVNAFEKAVKDNSKPNVTTEKWCGLDVAITHTISLKDMMSLVSEVADNCFLENGRYIPEMMQPLLECCVVDRYTNINLPTNIESRYELVLRSGIMDFIMPRINSNQYNDIVVAIRDKVDYMCDARTVEFERVMEKMAESVDKLHDSANSLFENISDEDIKAVMAAFSGDKSIEQRVVEEYIKNKNEGSDNNQIR